MAVFKFVEITIQDIIPYYTWGCKRIPKGIAVGDEDRQIIVFFPLERDEGMEFSISLLDTLLGNGIKRKGVTNVNKEG